MMRCGLFLAGLMAVAGCGDSGDKADGGVDMKRDFAMEAPDDLTVSSLIGGPCTIDTNCTEGTKPVCFKKTLFNKTGLLPTAGGYCSSTCTSDADCGSDSHCENFGTLGGACLANCMSATDCRTPGYACFGSFGGCFPDGNLTCDPSAGDGTCTLGKLAGGCVRSALGTGNTGQCRESCEVGVGTCAADTNGPRHCVFSDGTHDSTQAATGDKFKGGLCDGVVTNPGPIADDVDCNYIAAGQTTGAHYIDVCVDGSECWTKFFGTTADEKCHKLCYKNNMVPASPDGGTNFADGGMPAGACPAGKTCEDRFGTFNTNNPIGLCSP